MSTKKIISESNIFEGVFSDSDDDNELNIDSIEDEIMYRVQEKHENVLRSFKEFMDNPEYITGKGDTRTNIVDRYCLIGERIASRTYNIPENKIDKMFKFLELCRRKGLKMMVYEKQLEYSGLMIDFDIFQNVEECAFNDGLARSAILSTVKLLTDFLDFSQVFKNGEEKYTIHAAVIKKPRVMYNSEKQCFKDGFHILLPGIKLNRETKRFLLNKAVDEEYYKDIFRAFVPVKGLSCDDYVDKNSAHVPVHFLGSATKMGFAPYYLFAVYTYDLYSNSNELSLIVNKCDLFTSDNLNSNIVICHELSLNWEKESGIIKKQNFFLKEEYILSANRFKTGLSSLEEDENVFVETESGELSLLKIHDPDVEYMVSLIDTLHPNRAIDYMDWYKVICVIANTSKSYKPIAEYFSKKCPDKYNQESFEKYWKEICSSRNNRLSIGSLHYWAKSDNPERYEAIRCSSIFDLIFKKIYDPQMEGHLQHYDIAQVLFKSLRHKYAFDTANGGTWFEFILPEEPHTKGEVYKWRSCQKPPLSIKRYVSELLPTLFRKVYDKILNIIENLKADKEASYHTLVKRNFQASTRNLKHTAFKNGVAHESEQVFEKIGFSANLDKEPDVLGVGNGLLHLGKECKFITGYHNYLISQYTSTDYIPFNPRRPLAKKLLIALRNLFPDDEPDTFNFIMHYLSSALDGKKKESLLLLLVGNGSNGKSFLVELFKETIGSTFAVKMPLAFLTSRQKNSESATPALMMLMNARFAYYSETEKAEILNSAKIKEVTGQETLGGRKNFGDYVNFKPTCHHLVTSNYDFEVNSTDHGTWRRLKRVSMKIKFCKRSVDDYDEKNTYERIADPSLGANWPDDPDVRSEFLGILIYYYESLQRNYDGIVESVPHPTIKNETEQFRNRQDKINSFINARIVKTVDSNLETPISIIIEKYSKWHDSLYPDDREYRKSVVLQFENSRLSKIIIKTRVGNFIKGYRVLDNNESPEEGETYFIDNFMERSNLNNIKLSPESAEEFHARICEEFDLYSKDKEAAIELEKRRQFLLSKEIEKYETEKNSKAKHSAGDVYSRVEDKEKKYNESGYKIKNELLLDDDFKDFIKESSLDTQSNSDEGDDVSVDFNYPDENFDASKSLTESENSDDSDMD
jgi:phage/plasmid-associated DNA primase